MPVILCCANTPNLTENGVTLTAKALATDGSVNDDFSILLSLAVFAQDQDAIYADIKAAIMNYVNIVHETSFTTDDLRLIY